MPAWGARLLGLGGGASFFSGVVDLLHSFALPFSVQCAPGRSCAVCMQVTVPLIAIAQLEVTEAHWQTAGERGSRVYIVLWHCALPSQAFLSFAQHGGLARQAAWCWRSRSDEGCTSGLLQRGCLAHRAAT